MIRLIINRTGTTLLLSILVVPLFAKATIQNLDYSFAPGQQMQSSRAKALALPERLIEGDLNQYITPSRVMEQKGAYSFAGSERKELWGGIVLPIQYKLPYDLKFAFFLHRPESTQSPLMNALVEPFTGNTEPFNNMIENGSTSLGRIDPSSKYLSSKTVLPSESLSDLCSGKAQYRSIGSIDFFQGASVGPVMLGMMFSYLSMDKNEEQTLQDGTSRSIKYSSEEKRFSIGCTIPKTDKYSIDLSVTIAQQDISFAYNALTSSSYPVVGYENLSESLFCNSKGNTEINAFLRVIADLNPLKLYGTLNYFRYSMPIEAGGKLLLGNNATHTVLYDTAFSMINFDIALYQAINEKMTVIYSLGYMTMSKDFTKSTDTSPISGDASIWGLSRIDDARTIELNAIPAGVAIECRVHEKGLLRTGLRKYLWAPYSSKYNGHTGNATSSFSESGQFSDYDQFYASIGVSILPSEMVKIDIDMEQSCMGLSENNKKASSFSAGASCRYIF